MGIQTVPRDLSLGTDDPRQVPAYAWESGHTSEFATNHSCLEQCDYSHILEQPRIFLESLVEYVPIPVQLPSSLCVSFSVDPMNSV